MVVLHRFLLLNAACSCVLSGAVRAQGPQLMLTQERRPTSSPWEDPALLSYSVDTRGKDNFNIQVNSALEWNLPDLELSGNMRRAFALGPYIIVNRNSQEKAPQSNIELGIRTTVSRAFYVPPALASRQVAGNVPPKQKWNAAFGLDAGYARTASYPDPEKNICVLSPDIRACKVQHKESVRSVAAAVFSIPEGAGGWGSGRSLIRYEIHPAIDLAYDHLLDNKINTDTNVVERGSYGSIAPSAKLGIYIGSESRIKAELSGQIRYRLIASNTRSRSIDKAAELGTASITYFFYQPPIGDDGAPTAPDWRVGASISYTRGSDPLTGKPNQSIILLAFKVGRF